MDKRQIKSLNKIHSAFVILLKQKPYSEITVQDILNEGDISRSTFYSHFTCKEDVLINSLDHIFDHVFAPKLMKENDHDFSSSSIFDYKNIIAHIFYHFQEEKELLIPIISSNDSIHFINALKPKIFDLMSAINDNYFKNKQEIPTEIRLDQLIQSFISLITYWLNSGCKITPEKMTEYFFKLFE